MHTFFEAGFHAPSTAYYYDDDEEHHPSSDGCCGCCSACAVCGDVVGGWHLDAPARPDDLSVRTTLVVGGYLACVVSACFCVTLVFLSPGPVNPQTGALRYISEGMLAHCGYATAVMGTCSMLLLACQVLAGAHMQNTAALGWALAQGVGWNVLIGVSDTGWVVHYFGLAGFLAGNLAYHYLAARDPAYGGPYYVRASWLAICAAGVFVTLVSTNIFIYRAAGGTADPTLQSFAVAFEFVLMLALAGQNACLVNALDQFEDIHLQFVSRRR